MPRVEQCFGRRGEPLAKFQRYERETETLSVARERKYFCCISRPPVVKWRRCNMNFENVGAFAIFGTGPSPLPEFVTTYISRSKIERKEKGSGRSICSRRRWINEGTEKEENWTNVSPRSKQRSPGVYPPLLRAKIYRCRVLLFRLNEGRTHPLLLFFANRTVRPSRNKRFESALKPPRDRYNSQR